MRCLLIWALTLLNSILCFSQDVNPQNLAKQIEIVKDNFRNIGLNNLDKIEGIYYLNETRVSKDYVEEFAPINGTMYLKYFTSIKRDEVDKNRFDIYTYQEYNGGAFYKMNTKWYILKVGSKYIVSCTDCSDQKDFYYYENDVTFYENKISFKEESKNKNFPGAHSSTFSTIQKIFPTTSEENIFKTGTGFIISTNGYILTNYHVIENCTNIYLSNQIYHRLIAKVVYTDVFNDIALLKSDISLKTIPYNIVSTQKEIGNNVFTLGFPYIQSMGKDVKLTNGIINSNSGYENDSRYYQFSAEIQPGNSGGPLFDSDGNIVGMVTAKHNMATNAGYAIKSKFLIDFIKFNNPAILKLNINSLKNLNLSAKYKLIQNYVLLLEIE